MLYIVFVIAVPIRPVSLTVEYYVNEGMFGPRLRVVLNNCQMRGPELNERPRVAVA